MGQVAGSNPAHSLLILLVAVAFIVVMACVVRVAIFIVIFLILGWFAPDMFQQLAVGFNVPRLEPWMIGAGLGFVSLAVWRPKISTRKNS
jgi:hypothetical protein